MGVERGGGADGIPFHEAADSVVEQKMEGTVHDCRTEWCGRHHVTNEMQVHTRGSDRPTYTVTVRVVAKVGFRLYTRNSCWQERCYSELWPKVVLGYTPVIVVGRSVVTGSCGQSWF